MSYINSFVNIREPTSINFYSAKKITLSSTDDWLKNNGVKPKLVNI